MAEVRLTKGKHARILDGHPWIYANEILEVAGETAPGNIIDVRDYAGEFMGRGYLNPRSQISVRLLTREDESIDKTFFAGRLQRALNYRLQVMPGQSSYRLVHAEADFLPGLIVDKFGDYLVFQTLALGIDLWKDTIVSLLQEMLSPKGIYERNDAPVRELEGLEQLTGFASEPFDTLVEIEENGLRVLVDIQRGQKTGYFLDQRENRSAVRRYSPGRSVLDCFCYSGGFSLNAAAGGAAEVLGIDQAESALDLARANALENKATACSFEQGNAFDVLRQMQKQGRAFDMVILDPPAFAKSRSALSGAVRGYKEINLRALKILRPGGILASCSCSHHLSEEMLFEIVREAASDTGVVLRLIEKRGAAPDHPVLVPAPETGYLKCLIFEVS